MFLRCAGAIRPPPSVDRISTSVFGRLQVAAEFLRESIEHQAEEAAAAQVCRAIEPDAARSVGEGNTSSEFLHYRLLAFTFANPNPDQVLRSAFLGILTESLRLREKRINYSIRKHANFHLL